MGGMTDVIKKYQKKFGEKTIVQGAKLVDTPRCATGFFEFDLASGGGFPRGRASVVFGPESSGKCHAPGTPILMHDGSLKKVEDIKAGDVVMGPDSMPRTVLVVHTGFGELFRVTPSFGRESFVVNGDHKLVLKQTKDGWGKTKGDVTVISVYDWLSASKEWRLYHHLWRPAGVEFRERDIDLDPYFLGLWLGDGSNYAPSVTTGDAEVVSFLTEYAKRTGLNCVRYDTGSGCETWALTGTVYGPGYGSKGLRERPWTVRDGLNAYGLLQNKHVPDAYRRNSLAVRRQVLAGLLDSDGFLGGGTGSMVFSNTNERLVDDVLFLARSVGLRATKTVKNATLNGEPYTSFLVYMAGDFSQVPIRIPRKKPSEPSEWKDRLCTGFKVEAAGEGAFYGFELDGDHLYVAGDFVVHHNTNAVLRAIALNQQLNPKEDNVFFEVEPLDYEWASFLGVDLDRLIVVKPDFAEQAVFMMEDVLQAENVGIVALDSLAAMITTKELNSDSAYQAGGSSPAVGALVRRTTFALDQAEKAGRYPCLVYINQTRFKMGVMHGNPEDMPGGNAPKFQSALTVRFYGKNITDDKVSKTVPVFKETSFVIRKWKVPIIATHGVYQMATMAQPGLKIGETDSWSTVLGYMKELGQVAKKEKGQGWIAFGHEYQTLAEIKSRYSEDREWAALVRQAVVEQVMEQAKPVAADGPSDAEKAEMASLVEAGVLTKETGDAG